MTRAFPRTLLAVLAASLLVVGCDTTADPTLLAPDAAGTAATSAVPAQGTATTLDFGTWNLEWFGDTSNGPGNEALQLENVRDILAGLDMDLWSVQEVTGHAHFADLVSQLSGYDGFLADDPVVVGGDAWYSDFEDNELKVGLIYKSSMVTVNGAQVILTDYDYEFAGRPPVEVSLTVTVDGTALDLVVILLHAKAGAAGDDWQRRYDGSVALKSYLDTIHPTASVMVIGDFNDDVDTSITNRPTESPYRNFVDDAADFAFPTKALSDAGISSTVYYDDMIDHHLGTNELVATYVSGSAQVFPADQYLDSYDQTTSDHYPVLSSFTAGSGDDGGTTNGAPTASFTYSCTDLACSFDGTASSDPDGDALAYSWDFGDGATASGATASHTYAAGGTYTATLTVSDGSLSDSEAQSVSVSEPSSGGITLSATGYKVRGQQKADLSWSGATSTSIDVYRDGGLVATTANDGAHTDPINNTGGGSYTYVVCEAGTSTCSAEATVVF